VQFFYEQTLVSFAGVKALDVACFLFAHHRRSCLSPKLSLFRYLFFLSMSMMLSSPSDKIPAGSVWSSPYFSLFLPLSSFYVFLSLQKFDCFFFSQNISSFFFFSLF